jgi:hypothetical protein
VHSRELPSYLDKRPDLGKLTRKRLPQAYHGEEAVGVIVCKQDLHRGKLERGYIAMLSTKPSFRKFGIGESPHYFSLLSLESSVGSHADTSLCAQLLLSLSGLSRL